MSTQSLMCVGFVLVAIALILFGGVIVKATGSSPRHHTKREDR